MIATRGRQGPARIRRFIDTNPKTSARHRSSTVRMTFAGSESPFRGIGVGISVFRSHRSFWEPEKSCFHSDRSGIACPTGRQCNLAITNTNDVAAMKMPHSAKHGSDQASKGKERLREATDVP